MYVDIRATYVAQTYLPLVHNFYPYAEQRPNIGVAGIALSVGDVNQYCSLVRPVLVHFMASESHCIYSISETICIGLISSAWYLG